MSRSARAAVLIVLALALAGACIWYFSRLLAAGSNPIWYLLPGFGFALAYVLGRAGLSARDPR